MKRKNRFAYTKRPGSTSLKVTGKPSQTAVRLLKLYQDCRIPLNLFLDCLFDKDYTALIISGEPAEDELMEAWQKIYLEYAELVNDGSSNELYNKTIEINYLNTKVFIIDKIVTHFKLSYNEDLIKILKYYGVDPGITAEDDTETRLKKLETVVARSKRWITQLDILRKEFEVLQDTGKTKSSGREGFESNLFAISSFQKYSILEKDISVRQYVRTLARVESAIAKLEAKNV